ncbi:MAG: sensor histidine kinase, partial [Candidatus Ratteibacteria bacterium]
NIINNSIDAVSLNGEIEIITRKKENLVEITFIDNGHGIKKEHIDKVFEPFFTTKEPGQGIGLGLYLTYNYIKMHNGDINIESEEGKGTKVIIEIPFEKNGYK